jgi:hypothetical protein
MKKIIVGMLLLGLVIANPASANEGVTPMLKMDTTYHFMDLFPYTDAAELPGRPEDSQWGLAWLGTVLGDVDGVIRWWAEFYPNPEFPTDPNPVVLTGVGRWEIWDCDPDNPLDCNFDDTGLLMMAGTDAFGYVSPIDWEGKGVVTYTSEEYAEWFAHRITDGGWVDFTATPWYGEGTFIIYNKPSQKH